MIYYYEIFEAYDNWLYKYSLNAVANFEWDEDFDRPEMNNQNEWIYEVAAIFSEGCHDDSAYDYNILPKREEIELQLSAYAEKHYTGTDIEQIKDSFRTELNQIEKSNSVAMTNMICGVIVNERKNRIQNCEKY